MAGDLIVKRVGRCASVATVFVSAVLICMLPPAYAASDDGVSPGGWERVENPPDTSKGQVLELPQMTNPDDSSSATPDDGGSSDTKFPLSADANPGQSAAPDQLGNINDYEAQEAGVVVLIPSRAVRIPRINAAGPGTPPSPMLGGMFPSRPIIISPAGISPIPATSPMLTPPLGTGATLGGWTSGH
jgi:hypothetical protein